MAFKLSMKTPTCRADARSMLNGVDPTVSGLHRIAGVGWLFSEEEQFSSSTALQLVDLEGLPGDNTVGPLNTRSMTDVRHQVPEKELHQTVEGSFCWRTGPTTGITKWGNSSPNPRDKLQASTQDTIPESHQWKATEGGTRTWSHQKDTICLRLITLRK